MDRRCTLNCQGCHVNPNGGGIRNQYGVWNQSRWLRSFSTSFLSLNQPHPAPISDQPYFKAKKGEKRPAMAVVSDADMVSTQYARDVDMAWKTLATSEEDALSTIPSVDPYYLERSRFFTAGGDFRYSVIKKFADTAGDTSTKNWLMAVDFGVRARPTPRYASVVLEARYFNGPDKPSLEAGVTREARIRSAYVLVDDLPLNSYAMYGLYRPMFGHYDGNHYSISAIVSGLSQRAVYKSLGVGMAPNVPFFNLNLISPIDGTGFDQSSGFVANVGARWVTLGASFMLSYWDTKAPEAGADLLRRMVAISGGLSFRDLIWNSEILYVRKEFSPGLFDSGMIYSNYLMYRMWREIYLTGSYSTSNIALNLKEGSADEMTIGAKMLAFAGTELDLYWSNRNSRLAATATNVKSVQLHAHLFF